jgi:membrane-bound metal-dependent hydrolase YbcI (DUF457 family)
MFIGHFAVAFAAKRSAPSVSLGTLFIACELVDLVWPMLVLLGVETVRIAPGNTAFTPLEFVHYPWTHSLVMSAAWALVAAALYFLVRRDVRTAMVVGAVVLSHWFLDAAVHRPDLPLVPGGAARIGFSLWNSVPATVAVEGLMFCAAVLLYAKSTRALDRAGRIGLWALIAFLIAAYCAAAFGPPPPNVQAVAWAGIVGGSVTALWAYWINRHRETVR